MSRDVAVRMGLAAMVLTTMPVATAACSGGQPATSAGPASASAVDMDLPSDSGQLVRIPQPSSKLTVVDAFGPTCEPCREKVPALAARREELSAKGARLVLVAVLGDGETTEQAATALRSWGAPSPFLVDRGQVMARQLGLKELPSSYVIDRDGRVLWSGGSGATADDIVAAVDAAAEASP